MEQLRNLSLCNTFAVQELAACHMAVHMWHIYHRNWNWARQVVGQQTYRAAIRALAHEQLYVAIAAGQVVFCLMISHATQIHLAKCRAAGCKTAICCVSNLSHVAYSRLCVRTLNHATAARCKIIAPVPELLWLTDEAVNHRAFCASTSIRMKQL